jgi:uncharacterized membrane protein YbhN (UPF0104 family)
MGKSRESSIRWTGIVLTQLGYAINLVLTFATATLGFTLSLLRDKDFAPPLGARRLFELALAALLASIIVGVACVVNRLTDFRASRRIATRREKLEEKDMPRGEINEASVCLVATTKIEATARGSGFGGRLGLSPWESLP